MLTRLRVRDFRNLEPLTFEPGEGTHLLLGGNGAGKTSLLEALYVVATTKSFRTHRLIEAVRHDAEDFELTAEVVGSARRTLGLAWDRAGRRRTVNGKEGPLAEHLETLPVVAWTAADAELLTGAPVLRRRLLDRGIVNSRPATLSLLGRYREALGAKRRLLLEGRRGAELETWNELLGRTGAELARLRAEHVADLAHRLAEVLSEIALPIQPVTLRYRPSPPNSLEGADAVSAALARVSPSELERRVPLLGPHRDDLEILWGGHPVRQVASAGERKALSLALAASQARILAHSGRFALVLLDDADAELAESTLIRLWPAFSGATQLLASSNRPEVWRSLEPTFRWRVDGGVVSRLNP